MANRVKISTIGAVAPRIETGPTQKSVDAIIEFWRGKFEAVLLDRPDLIVMPEVCDAYQGGASNDIWTYYDIRGDQILGLVAATARRHCCCIAYSAVRKMGDGSWRNSTRLIDRTGQVAGIYNKNHPTELELDDNILAGAEAPLIECDFGRVGCAICFDLNFDRLRVQYVAKKPDLILFSSVYHGGLMQAYWAYSCRSHFVSSIGGSQHCPSHVISPVGRVLASTTNYRDFVTTTVNLDCRIVHYDFHVEQLRALKQKYGPGVVIDDPGHLGSVLITSEMDDRTTDDLVQEFDLMLLDDYFERALAARDKRTESVDPGKVNI